LVEKYMSNRVPAGTGDEGSQNDLAYRTGKYVRNYPVKSAILLLSGVLLLVWIYSYEETVDPQFKCVSSSGSMSELVWEIKQQARNPHSFEHIQTSATPVDAEGRQRIRMKFRAQNGFGGMTIETAEALVSNPNCRVLSWSIL
jgi:hypothetical protein